MEASTAQPSSPRHPHIVTALLVAATLLTFVGIFSIWVNRQALNTDNWVNTSSRLLENKDIQDQVAPFLVNQLYANVNVQAELQKKLPPQAQALAGPAAGGLRQLAQQVALKALATPQVQAVWAAANRAAHKELLQVIDGGGPVVSTGGGQVTLHLGTLVAQIGSQIGLPSSLVSKLPPSAGSFTVLNSKQLSTAQSIAKLIRRLPIVLTALVILLYGAAIYLARGRRREALRSVGFGFIVAGALVLILRSLAGNSVVDSLTTTASVKPAAEAVWSIGTSLLVTVASSAIAFGILIVIGAWLAGPTGAAVALRREASPYLRERRGAAYAVAGVVWLALIAWAPIAAFRKPFGILLFAVLFALGTEVLRRQTLREFPETRLGELGDRMRDRGRQVSTAFAGRRVATTPATGEVGGAAGSASSKDAQLERLERLSALRQQGSLTEEEFEAQKREVLSSG